MLKCTFITAVVVALASATGAVAEQPADPSGYGQARAADANGSSGSYEPGEVGAAISDRASNQDGTSEGDISQSDLKDFSGNFNGVRSN